MDIKDLAFAAVLITLGISFGYKCVIATFVGRSSYWSGFLPVGIVSPLFIHLPAGKNSLIKPVQGWWVHVLLGPIFFLCSLLCLASGADLVGLPGTQTVNFIMTFGREDVPPAITFSKGEGFKFPIVKRVQTALFKAVTKPVLEEQAERDNASIKQQMSK